MPSPSSPKRTPRTGSLLLGRELRRLRGTRRLRDIAELSRSEPIAQHVQPISEAGLCEIESGKTMPSLGTIQTLAMVYKVSVSQLLAYVSEERLLSRASERDLPDAPEAEFARLLSSGEWSAALAVAARAEAACSDAAGCEAWRANRALCLSRMGQHDQAVTMLLQCLESADEPVQRLGILRALADCMSHAGQLRSAGMALREATDSARDVELPPALQASLDIARANNVADACRYGRAMPDRTLREALRLLERAGSVWPSDDVAEHLRLALTAAELQHALGNSLVAARDAVHVRAESRKCNLRLAEAQSCWILGLIHEGSGRVDAAEQAYSEALGLIDAKDHVDLEFELSFRLYRLRRQDRPGAATRHLKRCDELFPLLASRTPLVAECESTLRSRS